MPCQGGSFGEKADGECFSDLRPAAPAVDVVSETASSKPSSLHDDASKSTLTGEAGELTDGGETVVEGHVEVVPLLERRFHLHFPSRVRPLA
jgi:hypothetical protein